MTITANEVKVRGITVIKEALRDGNAHAVTDRGKLAFFAVPAHEFERFREWQLDKAIEEAEADYEAGNFKVITDVNDYVNGLVND